MDRTKSSDNGTGMDNNLRRSSRKRQSTTITVQGGHVVKKINNYVVRGDTYSHGTFDDEEKSHEPRAKKSKSKPNDVKKQNKKLNERMNHNDIVKKRMKDEEVLRTNFMVENIDILEPFLEEKVLSRIRLKSSEKMTQNSSIDNFRLHVQPETVVTKLRPYQITGVEWMMKMNSHGLPLILGDEMGLGKTLQTISVIALLKERSITGPSLVICPLSVLASWCDEIDKHAPKLKFFRLHATGPKERMSQIATINQGLLDYDIIVTTYDNLKCKEIQNGIIRTTFFNISVLDEGHVIKNTETIISESVRKIHSQNKMLLTGTPLQNNLVELYAILNYMYPEYFTSPKVFEKAFSINTQSHNVDPDILLKANKLLSLFMIRRMKKEVEKLLPEKVEIKILCPLSSTQKFWYKGFLMNEVETLIKATEDPDNQKSNGNYKKLNNLVMQLRKCCLHPYTFSFVEDDIEETSLEDLVAASGKLAVLDKVLLSLYRKKHRTVLYSHFTYILDILEDYCVMRGWNYVRFDGSTQRAQRLFKIKQFNAPKSEVFIFLISTKAGGTGINLQTADTCILFDSDWNPQHDLQAMARVHRIGQKKTVHVYRLICSQTIEERILERATKKLYLDQMVNKGGSNQSLDLQKNNGGLSFSELLASLQFGSNAILKSSNRLPTDDEIDILIDRNRDIASSGMFQGGAELSAKDFKADEVVTDTKNFIGIDFRKLLKEKEESFKETFKGNKVVHRLRKDTSVRDISTEEFGRGKRVKKSRIQQISGMGSGYGKAFIPVLSMNNYNLEDGELSVWRETKRSNVHTREKEKSVSEKFRSQAICQVCCTSSKKSEFLFCRLCPIVVHQSCCGTDRKHYNICTHHHCSVCKKTTSAVGGLLFCCQACPKAFCSDCAPSDIQLLDNQIPRFEELGYTPNDSYYFIHCSKKCERKAKSKFGYKVDRKRHFRPSPLELSYAFGENALSMEEIKARKYQEKTGKALPQSMNIVEA